MSKRDGVSSGARRDRALIVEDDQRLGPALHAMLVPRYSEVRLLTSAQECLELLNVWIPDLLVLDVCLPDGSAFDIIAHLRKCSPTPYVVAMSGQARVEETFRLGQLGVRSFLSKPFGAVELEAALAVAEQPPDVALHLRNMVGAKPVQQVVEEVRSQMVSEALAQARGNRRYAARLLQISRQLLQYMLRADAAE